MARNVAAVLADLVDIAMDPLLYSFGSWRERPTAVEALRGDWERVGKDLWTGVERAKAAQEARGSVAPKPKPAVRSVSPSTSPPDLGDSGSREGAALISAQFSGLVPLLSHLEDYEQILPGAVDRIVRMGESEQTARHLAKKDTNRLETFKTRWGFVAWALTLGAVQARKS